MNPTIATPSSPARRWLCCALLAALTAAAHAGGLGDVAERHTTRTTLRGTIVVTDIGDTIKITHVNIGQARGILNPLAIFDGIVRWRPVPGMAELYQDWAQQGAQFIYLSGEPESHERRMREELEKNGFPAGRIYLNGYGGTAIASQKISMAIDLFERHPRAKFVFVGDSGERDPEIFGELARTYPQLRRIYIRRTTDDADLRYTRAFRRLPQSMWWVFREPDELGRLP